MDPQPVQPSPKPSPLLPVLAVLIGLLFCVTAYLFFQNLQLKKQITELTNQPIPLVSLEPTAKADDPTANWKTYIDKENNISFQYPNDWIIHKPEGGNGADPCCNLWFTVGKDRLLDITIFENSYDDAIKKASLIYASNPEPITNYTFQGTWFTNDLDGEYILNVNGKALSLHYFFISRDYDNGMAIMASRILFTFKFVDQTTTPQATYTCPSTGWVDCMPILDEAKKKACSEEAMTWYKANCPNFKGGAL